MLDFKQANPLPDSLYFYCRKFCTLIAEFFVLELPKILYFTLPFPHGQRILLFYGF